MRSREEWHPVIYIAEDSGPSAKAYPIQLAGCASQAEALTRAIEALRGDPRVVCVSARRFPRHD